MKKIKIELNEKVPITEEWKKTILRAISIRRQFPEPEEDCLCCKKVAKIVGKKKVDDYEEDCDPHCPLGGENGFCVAYSHANLSRLILLNELEKLVKLI